MLEFYYKDFELEESQPSFDITLKLDLKRHLKTVPSSKDASEADKEAIAALKKQNKN